MNMDMKHVKYMEHHMKHMEHYMKQIPSMEVTPSDDCQLMPF